MSLPYSVILYRFCRSEKLIISAAEKVSSDYDKVRTWHALFHKEAGYVKISVADNGIGIPAEDIPHIWDEFFRAKNAHLAGITGTGLGLSIVRQYVDRFGGQVGVVSNLGRGTTFTVSLRIK